MDQSKCPYESGDLAGQVIMEAAIEEWKRENQTPYDSAMTYFRKVKGYKNERRKITHKDIDFVTTKNLAKGCTGTIIKIVLPEEYKLGICNGVDNQKFLHNEAYPFRIKATGADGEELDGSTEVEIYSFHTIQQSFRSCLPPPHCVYYEELSNAGEPFKFYAHIVIDKDVNQLYRVRNSNINIKNIEYYGIWDLWR